MFYKLLNKLFGWDYVALTYYPFEGNILRVQQDYIGSVYTRVGRISEDRAHIPLWLTCHPSKYFPGYGLEAKNGKM